MNYSYKDLLEASGMLAAADIGRLTTERNEALKQRDEFAAESDRHAKQALDALSQVAEMRAERDEARKERDAAKAEAAERAERLERLGTAHVELAAENARQAERIKEQERRYNQTIHALTHLYESLGRQGWEDGVTESEAVTLAHSALCEHYGDPYPRKNREIPKMPWEDA